MGDIFKNREAPPPKENNPEVVSVAMTMREAQADLMPARFPNPSMDTNSVKRPRYGHAM